MATAYNAPNSQYNKSPYAKLTITESRKIEFSEAVIQYNDDKVLVFAYVTKCDDAKDFGSKDFVFSPQICTFEILRKPYTYKDKETKPTPGMLIAAHVLCALPNNSKIFGYIDFSSNEWDMDIVVTGMASGQTATTEMRQMIQDKSILVAEIEALKELEGKELPELKGKGSGGYSKGESEAEKIASRLKFLIDTQSADHPVNGLIALAGIEKEAWLADMLTHLF